VEEIIRLIENFSYDRMRAGKLSGKTSDFLFDLRTLVEDSKRSLEQEYERGKDDGWREGYDEAEQDQKWSDDDLRDELSKIEDLISDAISSLDHRGR
jgi:hypothetical protein